MTTSTERLAHWGEYQSRHRILFRQFLSGVFMGIADQYYQEINNPSTRIRIREEMIETLQSLTDVQNVFVLIVEQVTVANPRDAGFLFVYDIAPESFNYHGVSLQYPLDALLEYPQMSPFHKGMTQEVTALLTQQRSQWPITTT